MPSKAQQHALSLPSSSVMLLIYAHTPCFIKRTRTPFLDAQGSQLLTAYPPSTAQFNFKVFTIFEMMMVKMGSPRGSVEGVLSKRHVMITEPGTETRYFTYIVFSKQGKIMW